MDQISWFLMICYYLVWFEVWFRKSNKKNCLQIWTRNCARYQMFVCISTIGHENVQCWSLPDELVRDWLGRGKNADINHLPTNFLHYLNKNQHFVKLHRLIKKQIFHYTRCNTPKRVTSWRGPSPRHCHRATQLLSEKCRSGGEPLATLCPIWPARDLNLIPPALETNALPLDQLAGIKKTKTFRFQLYTILNLSIK